MPLMIPEPQLFNSCSCEKLCAFLVALTLFGQTVLEAVEFDGQFCGGTINIEMIDTDRVLAPELEPGKTSCPQNAPQFFFLLRLLAPETAGLGCDIHGEKRKRG